MKPSEAVSLGTWDSDFWNTPELVAKVIKPS